ncbi:MAG: hypothetical protein WD266_13625 [Balneolales bacterium]
MITLSGFLLLLAALYGTIRLLFFSRIRNSLFYLCLAVSALSLAVGIVGTELETYFPWVDGRLFMDWSRIVSISFIMSGLSVLLWLSKPVFARFPFVFCALPLLLIAAFPFARESDALKEMVLAMFQGGAILIAIMLFVLKGLRNPNNYYVVAGISLIVIAYLMNFTPASYLPIDIWMIKLVVAAAIVLIIHGLTRLTEEEDKTESFAGP